MKYLEKYFEDQNIISEISIFAMKHFDRKKHHIFDKTILIIIQKMSKISFLLSYLVSFYLVIFFLTKEEYLKKLTL